VRITNIDDASFTLNLYLNGLNLHDSLVSLSSTTLEKINVGATFACIGMYRTRRVLGKLLLPKFSRGRGERCLTLFDRRPNIFGVLFGVLYINI